MSYIGEGFAEWGRMKREFEALSTLLQGVPGESLEEKVRRLVWSQRCPDCNGELSQCGEPDPDGEPLLDCVACRLRERIAELEAAAADHKLVSLSPDAGRSLLAELTRLREWVKQAAPHLEGVRRFVRENWRGDGDRPPSPPAALLAIEALLASSPAEGGQS
jgi:hypothetical protein